MPEVMNAVKRPRREQMGPQGRASSPEVCIDFPREGEDISLAGWTLRVGAPGSSGVEVSIEGGVWQSCRESAGHWWYDWTGYAPGPHETRARAGLSEERNSQSEPRRLKAVA